MKQKLKNKKGFTLVELLTVVAIIAVLVVISIPLVTGAISEAEKAADDANLRSAKAVAALTYLTNKPTEKKEYYFDNVSGELTTTPTPSPYGHGKNTVIKVVIDPTPTDAEEAVSATWETSSP